MLPYLTSFRVRADGVQLGERPKPAPAPATPSMRPIFVRMQAFELPDALLPWELAALAGCGPDNLDGQGEVSDRWVKRLGKAAYHGGVSVGADGRIDRAALQVYLGSIDEKAEGWLASWLGKDAAEAVGEIVKACEAEKRLKNAGYGGLIYLIQSPTKKGHESIQACRPPGGERGWVWAKLIAAVEHWAETKNPKSVHSTYLPPEVSRFAITTKGRG